MPSNSAHPALLSQALGVRAMLHFLRGDGIDEPSLRGRSNSRTTNRPRPTALQPSVQHALHAGLDR